MNAILQACRPFVVEDDPDFRLFLVRAFEKAGVPGEAVRWAADGEAAIAALGASASGAPSVVVLDVHLPKRSGLDVLEWIRGSSPFPKVPAFILTSSEKPEDVRRAGDLRADGYFQKPAGSQVLLEIVRQMLGYRSAASGCRPG